MIGESWTVEEILDAAALDELEGAGQAKRLIARVCAEIHNALRTSNWQTHGKEGTQPPARINESMFLPMRRTKQDAERALQEQRESVDRNMRAAMMSLCGF